MENPTFDFRSPKGGGGKVEAQNWKFDVPASDFCFPKCGGGKADTENPSFTDKKVEDLTSDFCLSHKAEAES